jgi:hypothetical protein
MKVACSLLLIWFTMLMHPLSVQDMNGSSEESTIFLPYSSLYFGPSPQESIPLSFNFVQYFDETSNNSLTIYNPNTVTNASVLQFLGAGENVSAVFDSYYANNRFKQQVMPDISNISLVLTEILNPDQVNFYSQASLSSPIVLQERENTSTDAVSYQIPNNITDGIYMANLTVRLPEYNLLAVYSNAIPIYSNETVSRALSILSGFGEEGSGGFGFGEEGSGGFGFGEEGSGGFGEEGSGGFGEEGSGGFLP